MATSECVRARMPALGGESRRGVGPAAMPASAEVRGGREAMDTTCREGREQRGRGLCLSVGTEGACFVAYTNAARTTRLLLANCNGNFRDYNNRNVQRIVPVEFSIKSRENILCFWRDTSVRVAIMLAGGCSKSLQDRTAVKNQNMHVQLINFAKPVNTVSVLKCLLFLIYFLLKDDKYSGTEEVHGKRDFKIYYIYINLYIDSNSIKI
jgi:hypothetical protein